VDAYFFFQAEDGIRCFHVTGVQTCALPISAAYALRARLIQTYGHLDVPRLYDDETGFALGRWINRARKAYAAGTLKPAQIKALEHLGIIWNLQTQAAERGLLHARIWAARHGHLAAPTGEMAGDFALGRWLTNRRAAARARADNGLEPDPTDLALAEIDPYWNPAWSITWQRLYYTARAYADASITLDDLPADFVTDDDEPLDRKSTRLNSSHVKISYAVFCLKK